MRQYDKDTFSFYQPNESLVDVVECYYHIKENNPQLVQREHISYPDGLPEIILNFGGDYLREDLITGQTSVVKNESYVVNGQRLRSYRIIQFNSCFIISIKLKPYGLYLLTKVEQSELFNKTILAKDILKDGNQFFKNIKLGNSVEDKIIHIESFLRCNRKNVRSGFDNIYKIIEIIKLNRGKLRVEEICAPFKITTRTLENYFKTFVGVTPKEYCALVQFNYFIINSSNPKLNLTEAALDSGYYDQAHLIRRFRSLTNRSPSFFLKELSILDHMNIEVLRQNHAFLSQEAWDNP